MAEPDKGEADDVRARAYHRAAMSEPRTFPVQLVQPDGTSGAAEYESPTGEPPAFGDVITIAGQPARVTDVTEVYAGDPPLIRAELVE